MSKSLGEYVCTFERVYANIYKFEFMCVYTSLSMCVFIYLCLYVFMCLCTYVFMRNVIRVGLVMGCSTPFVTSQVT